MKKIEKGAEGGIPPKMISPSTISNLLSKQLNQDIITYVIVPFLFSTCRECLKIVIVEKLRDGRCPDCLILLCCVCDFRGTEYDFHCIDYWVTDDKFWCNKHWKGETHTVCQCSQTLLDPKNRKKFEQIAERKRVFNHLIRTCKY